MLMCCSCKGAPRSFESFFRCGAFFSRSAICSRRMTVPIQHNKTNSNPVSCPFTRYYRQANVAPVVIVCPSSLPHLPEHRHVGDHALRASLTTVAIEAEALGHRYVVVPAAPPRRSAHASPDRTYVLVAVTVEATEATEARQGIALGSRRARNYGAKQTNY